MAAMNSLGVKVTLPQAEEMVKELDVNARGAIQMPQFIILMERHTQVGTCFLLFIQKALCPPLLNRNNYCSCKGLRLTSRVSRKGVTSLTKSWQEAQKGLLI